MDAYITIAKATIEKYVKSSRRLQLEEIQALLEDKTLKELTEERAGAFVSLHKNGHLRGCIGTIGPTADSLFDEIVYSAISACSSDPRFPPVQLEELPELEIKVDRLYPPELIKDISELDVIKYGVIVEKGRRRGLLLPNLEGVDTAEEQVAIAMQKAGIGSMEGLALYRFEVQRHE